MGFLFFVLGGDGVGLDDGLARVDDHVAELVGVGAELVSLLQALLQDHGGDLAGGDLGVDQAGVGALLDGGVQLL